MLSSKTILAAFYKAGINTVDHDGVEHAGYLAFVGLLALFPFLVFVVALAGFLAGGQAGAEFVRLVLAQLPPDMVTSLAPRITEITSRPPQGLLTVSILGAIWTSSSALEGYRTVLNRAYHVGTPPSYIWRRLLSIAQILILSFVVVMAMIVLVVLPIAQGKVVPAAGKAGVHLASGVIVCISITVVFLAISFAYYFLPNLKQSIHAVVWGAALVTLLWIAAARVLSFYLSSINPASLIYGSLGSVIGTLLFFYVGNVIFIYGAEFNYLLKLAHGEKIEQKEAVLDMAEGI
ncbi:MAG TPA: YihY/virulence factor BrkB family protein [Verrucomicrobiae bacterium]|jgi:membrane protein|nr:YihY/virulence factor BrkB family protein [Verrucomicrobiae bacterium]